MIENKNISHHMVTKFKELKVKKEDVLEHWTEFERELADLQHKIHETKALIKELEQKKRTKTKRAALENEIRKLDIRKLQLELLLEKTPVVPLPKELQEEIRQDNTFFNDYEATLRAPVIEIEKSQVVAEEKIDITKTEVGRAILTPQESSTFSRFLVRVIQFFTLFAVKKSTFLSFK